MAQALITPLVDRGYVPPEEVLGVVGTKESVGIALEKSTLGLRVVSADDPAACEAWEAPIKILAVKPQHLNLVQEQFNSSRVASISKNSLLISILAGVNLKRLKIAFPHFDCVRAVPNTPSLVRQGLTGLSFGKELNSKQRLKVKEIFEPISEVLELPEVQLDAFLALTSSGPAYVALIVEALADGAVAAGLPRALAHHLAIRTLAGSASLMQEKNLHPGQLKDMVASPGGTTIAALRHLEQVGVRSAFIEAVVAAAARSRELS